MSKELLQSDLVFIDTECTGTNMATDRICQICFKTENGFDTRYFRPSVDMSIKAMSVTHITNQFLSKFPTIDECPEYKQNLQSILDSRILVAHNVKFDAGMLQNAGFVITPDHESQLIGVICTLRVAREVFPEEGDDQMEYNLQYLRYKFDLDSRIEKGVKIVPHDAESDVYVLEALFWFLFEKMLSLSSSSSSNSVDAADDVIRKMVELSQPNLPPKRRLVAKFDFGKHKDKFVADVARTDKGYIEWLLNQKITKKRTRPTSSDEDEDWIHTLRFYLSSSSSIA